MKEIGGYIELDSYNRPMLHEDALALNCGRNALAYLFRARNIKKIKIPSFICDSVIEVCKRENVQVTFYRIGLDFRPQVLSSLGEDEWLYLINFYGQIGNDEIQEYASRYKRVIVDQANDYFAAPLSGVDTIFTCRKWFGVADGAFLYTDAQMKETIPQDESFNHMHFLLGRFERPASEFYGEYTANNRRFTNEPIKRMSRLTCNLLHAVEYEEVKYKRRMNFEFLHMSLGSRNKLRLKTATFMYPYMIEGGALLRQRLCDEKIYVPTLWPAVFNIMTPEDLEYKMSMNILPIPIDQRYTVKDMEYIVSRIKELSEDD